MAQEIDWQRYDELKGWGLSQRAIARELGIPENTLRTRLTRPYGRAQRGVPRARLW